MVVGFSRVMVTIHNSQGWLNNLLNVPLFLVTFRLHKIIRNAEIPAYGNLVS